MKIEFIIEAADDYKQLDGRLKKIVNIKMNQLEKNPYLGVALGNKNNIDLSGIRQH